MKKIKVVTMFVWRPNAFQLRNEMVKPLDGRFCWIDPDRTYHEMTFEGEPPEFEKVSAPFDAVIRGLQDYEIVDRPVK